MNGNKSKCQFGAVSRCTVGLYKANALSFSADRTLITVELLA